MDAKNIVHQEKQTNLKELKTVFLIGAFLSGGDKVLGLESLDELEKLCETFGLEVVGKKLYPYKKLDAGTYLGKGNLQEIKDLAQVAGAKIILFDDEITPNQQRNLENFFSAPVIDRTEIIIEVFAQRAQSKEAKLQIELAKIKYQFPRLRRMWTHLSRQSSGGGFVKGEGEKQIEIDRRLLRRRIDQMNKEIKEVAAQRDTQRRARERSGIPTFSLVGYTNAGKSTLLHALTGADVFIEDKLFATLDTTTRKLTLPSNQEVLVTDTVGFIRKIPHTLVIAFKSTLEEAIHTDVLIHVIDASHPMAELQAEATLEVLKELDAENLPIITVLNKVDACNESSPFMRLRFKYPRTVQISATDPSTLIALKERMVEILASLRSTVSLRIPQSEYKLVADLMKEGRVLSSAYEENDILLTIEIHKKDEYKVKKYMD